MSDERVATGAPEAALRKSRCRMGKASRFRQDEDARLPGVLGRTFRYLDHNEENALDDLIDRAGFDYAEMRIDEGTPDR